MAADGEPVRISPPYALRDDAGRQALLDGLTSLVAGLDGPAQVWHGPRPCRARRAGRGPAGDFVRELAAGARVRWTVVGGGSPLPAVAAEDARRLQLANARSARVLTLTRWPAAAEPGWTAGLAELCDAVTLHLRPVPAEQAERLLRRRLTSLGATAVLDEESGRVVDETSAHAADTAAALRRGLAAGTTRVLQVQVLLGIAADDDAGLAELDRQLHARATAAGAGLRPLTFQHGPGWAALSPGGAALAGPWRLLDAAAVAASLPHPVGPDEPGTGILAGADPVSGCPVLLDRFAGHNSTRLVVGTSGAGKSYATKLEVARQLGAGAQVVVVDPEGEFGPTAAAHGGLTVVVGQQGGQPGGIDPVGLACQPGLAAAEGLAVLSSWAAALLGAPLTPVDLALLDAALGILRRSAAHTPQDLLAVLAATAEHPPFTGATLPARLAPATQGSLAGVFAPNPGLAHPPDLVVFDLRSVPDAARPAVMAGVLAWSWAQTRGRRSGRHLLVVVDEAHLLLDDPHAAHLLAQFARRARKYGVGIDVVTQRLSDFLGSPSGLAVLANASTKLVLGCEDHERAAVTAGLGLTPAEQEVLRPGRCGRGLLISPCLRSEVTVVASPQEHTLACAGPR